MIFLSHRCPSPAPHLHLVGLAALTVMLVACAPGPEDGNGAAQAPAPEPTAARAADIEAAVDEHIAAWEAEDLESAVGGYAADAVGFDPVPPGKFQGGEAIEGWLADTFEALDEIDITLTERQVDTHGDAGWFHARYVFAAVPAEPAAEPVRDEGYVSMLWIRQEDGSYRMPLFHASPLPEAPPEEMAE